ncbi:MAG TPA: hypothetical protein VF732_10900 [Nitrospira sp.]
MRRLIYLFLLSLLLNAFVTESTSADVAPPAQDAPEAVPTEDYPLYDLIVDEKFLTPETKLVLLERATLTRLHPEQQGPLRLETFNEYEIFDGRLPLELVRDFVFKNQVSSKLAGHFGFGVRYRFVTGTGAEQETSLAPIPAAFPIQEEPFDEPPEIIDRLAFSRVAYTFGREQALIYTEYNRVDGSGAGFIVWLTQSKKRWGIFDSELVWAARPQAP